MRATGPGQEDRTIRVRFRIVVTLLCLALASVSTWAFVGGRRASAERVGQEATVLARALSQHASDLLSVVDLLQYDVIDTVARIHAGTADRETATRNWRERLTYFGAIDGICAFDRSGVAILSTNSDCARAPDRDWFQPYPTIGGTIRQIGTPVRKAVGQTWLIPTLHTWYDERSRPAGTVVVMLRSNYLSSFYNNYDMTGQSGISLLRADGILLSRFPQVETQIGTNLSELTLLRPLFGQSSGLISGASPIDGIERIRAFNRVPGTALIIMVGINVDTLPPWGNAWILSSILIASLIYLVVRVSRDLDLHLATNSDTRESMKLQARTDALTGLPNRRAFDEAIAREWRSADQNFSSLSMLLLDVDHFKSFNDTYGHQAGDECLRRVAYALRQGSFETVGHLARYGGEEFALLLMDVTPAVAALIAKHLRSRVEAMEIPHEGNGSVGVVTVSIGVSTLDFSSPLGSASPITLVAEADQALYEAKRTGRNKVQSFIRPVAELIALRA